MFNIVRKALKTGIAEWATLADGVPASTVAHNWLAGKRICNGRTLPTSAPACSLREVAVQQETKAS